MKPTIILLDNFDSFTYNLVDQCRNLGFDVTIYRNDLPLDLVLSAISKVTNPVVMLSPGPGNPQQAGILLPLIEALRGRVPMIGICLGHQALVQAYGGTVSGAGDIVHGKSAMMAHDGQAMFAGLTSPMPIARYHSLVASQVPQSLTISATLANHDMVMAVRQDDERVCGFQFHPESILTTNGAALLTAALAWAQAQPPQPCPPHNLSASNLATSNKEC
ncbi:Anthranilate synthase component 2 [Vibrio stylophorae]|uniref:anthranilate synthase n=1 Tax=Vibrio stylophorae TaxID=659351 RepID=A0ABM8ZST1_9VIBR|nr:aminodeoxychorismate/anthranilate synthase component II [Vibrio stylophorae]CAH0532984.1 Anthranilate synthase component 2 [Vibrio stylophorae]